jgi:hypothetical protein
MDALPVCSTPVTTAAGRMISKGPRFFIREIYPSPGVSERKRDFSEPLLLALQGTPC